MWWTDYTRAVKRGLRDKYGFKPLPGSIKDEPLLKVSNGVYPMTIDGKKDYVRVAGGMISCCNFKKPKNRKKNRKTKLTPNPA